MKFTKNGKWYFWDETAMYYYGPYDTEEIVDEAVKAYSEFLNTGNGEAFKKYYKSVLTSE